MIVDICKDTESSHFPDLSRGAVDQLSSYILLAPQTMDDKKSHSRTARGQMDLGQYLRLWSRIQRWTQSPHCNVCKVESTTLQSQMLGRLDIINGGGPTSDGKTPERKS